MQELFAGMVLVIAGPVDSTELLETRVTHAGVPRGERAALVPSELRAVLRPLVAEPARQCRENGDIVACLAGRFERLSAALYAALAARHRTLGLAPAGGSRKNDLGQLARLREED